MNTNNKDIKFADKNLDPNANDNKTHGNNTNLDVSNAGKDDRTIKAEINKDYNTGYNAVNNNAGLEAENNN